MPFMPHAGDFNLVLLDQFLKEEKLRWVGCCNELNAGYAAGTHWNSYANIMSPADPRRLNEGGYFDHSHTWWLYSYI